MRRATPLLARYAEGLFWMARYLERVENLARLIEVTQSFATPTGARGGEPGGQEAGGWFALVRLNADEAGFAARGLVPSAEAVKRFYLLDAANPTSIPAALEAARTNARTLRPLISTEMWSQLNAFHREMQAVGEADLAGDHLTRLCAWLKEGVQTHTGITLGTFYRDQAWRFYQLGRMIECADQTTRLLDVRYHLLMPVEREARRVAEMAQWAGVLRGVAGYHAFRRVAPLAFTPADVVAFLLIDRGFPRSVRVCVERILEGLTALRRDWGLHATARAQECAENLRGGLLGQDIQTILDDGLHEFLDHVQRDLIALASEIGTAFFRDWRPLAPKPQSVAQAEQ